MITDNYSHTNFLRDYSKKNFHPSFTLNLSLTSFQAALKLFSFRKFHTSNRKTLRLHANVFLIISSALDFRRYKSPHSN